MHRRDFFKTIGTALAGFAILPPATTYERIWRALRTPQQEVTIELFVDLDDSPAVIHAKKAITTAPGRVVPQFGSIVTLSHFGGDLSAFNGDWISEGDGKLVQWFPIEPKHGFLIG